MADFSAPDTPSNVILLKELHGDLCRKYGMHTAAIRSTWRSFGKNQRARCLKAGAKDGILLKYSSDESLGNVCKIMPELNLFDVTESGSDFLLDLIQRRATTSLFEQYSGNPNGDPGDLAFIEEMIGTTGLQHADCRDSCFTMFLNTEEYGISYKILANQAEILSTLGPAIHARLVIPRSTGQLVILRQTCLLQHLNIIIEDILDCCSQSRSQTKRPMNPDRVALHVSSKLSFRAPEANIAFRDLTADAQDQKADLEDYLSLLLAEAGVLAPAVNAWFFSQPGLVADEKGRVLPVYTDKHISAALFEVIHGAIKASSIWKYIVRLLRVLESSTLEKLHRTVVLQELSNSCNLEYRRAQSVFKRHVQTGSGSKWFRRISTVSKNFGDAHVIIKGNPQELTRKNPQLHYMLRLCQPETSVSKAIDWIKKLSDLHSAYPLERDRVGDREIDALSNLTVIVGFVQDLVRVVTIPPFSRKQQQRFISKSQELEVELKQLQNKVDMRDFAVPISNLLQPGMAENALKILEQCVSAKGGSKLEDLYQELVEDCFNNLQEQYQRPRIKQEDKLKPSTYAAVVRTPQLEERRLEQRKQKEKTRPAHSSSYESRPWEETCDARKPTTSPLSFKVSRSTADVFMTIFNKSLARGSVSWAAFEAAMGDLGFSVVPKFGSVFTFYPPDTMLIKKSFTAHRPHKSKIEGYMIFIFAKRLRRVFGWDDKTFQVACD